MRKAKGTGKTPESSGRMPAERRKTGSLLNNIGMKITCVEESAVDVFS